MPSGNAIVLTLFCTTLIMGCSGDSPNQQFIPLDLNPPEVGFTELEQTQQAPAQLNSEPESDVQDSVLYDGNINWNLDGLTVDVVGPPSGDVAESQLVLVADDDDDGAVTCSMRVQYLASTIGIETQFTHFTRNLDINYISIDDFDAQNGPAKEYLSTYTLEDGTVINTVGHFYYFPAEQLSYSDTTSFNLKCSTSANLYALNEARLRKIMATVEFRVVEELANSLNEDWTNQRSVENDDNSRLRFRNQSSEELVIFWVNFEGDRIRLGTVTPGDSMSLDSFANHLVVVTDLSSAIVGQFRMGSQDSLAVIR